MSKEILTLGNIEIEKKKKITVIRLLFFAGDKDIEKVSNKGEKTIRPLLVTCIMVIPLYH